MGIQIDLSQFIQNGELVEPTYLGDMSAISEFDITHAVSVIPIGTQAGQGYLGVILHGDTASVYGVFKSPQAAINHCMEVH